MGLLSCWSMKFHQLALLRPARRNRQGPTLKLMLAGESTRTLNPRIEREKRWILMSDLESLFDRRPRLNGDWLLKHLKSISKKKYFLFVCYRWVWFEWACELMKDISAEEQAGWPGDTASKRQRKKRSVTYYSFVSLLQRRGKIPRYKYECVYDCLFKYL